MKYYPRIYYIIGKLCSLLHLFKAYEIPSNMFGLLTNHFSDTIPNGKILVHPSSGNHEVVNQLNHQLAYNSLTGKHRYME